MPALLTGLVMLVVAGLGWAVTGTLLSHLARRRIPAAPASPNSAATASPR